MASSNPTGKLVAGFDTAGEAITDRPGRRVTLLTDTEELALTAFEYGPGERGASPHVHSDHSDAFLVLEGELEITVGFEVFTLHAGEALGFDSATPHLLSNRTDAPARGIWFVRHPHA